jgi:transcriptional regulator GlxA family with amidase domain
LTYQQRVRVEKAKRMLEKGNRSFEKITYQVGYEDSGSFRKVFIRQAGLRPTEYRTKFQSI